MLITEIYGRPRKIYSSCSHIMYRESFYGPKERMEHFYPNRIKYPFARVCNDLNLVHKTQPAQTVYNLVKPEYVECRRLPAYINSVLGPE